MEDTSSKMSPFPSKRSPSPSTHVLEGSKESLNERGECNEAFEEGDAEAIQSYPNGGEERNEGYTPKEDPSEKVDLSEAPEREREGGLPSQTPVPPPRLHSRQNSNLSQNTNSANFSQGNSNPASLPYTTSSTSVGQQRISNHSRGASAASVGPLTSKELCHSRGASTDGSTIDAYTSSATESRRGTYSEAGTLPVGMQHEGTPIIEENGTFSEKIVEKQLSNGVAGRKAADRARWKAARNKWNQFTRPIMHKQNALPPDPSKVDKMKYAMSCPPHGKMGRSLTWILFLLLFWGSLVYITGDMALPGGSLFSLTVLVVSAEIGGRLVAPLRLPPLLGMLLVGILYRSVNGIDLIGKSIGTEWSSSLRSMALVVILIRAGLGLDPKALKKLSFVVLRLAMMPCLVETITVAIVSNLLLNFPWKWGFMLGFILSAVSPAVVVPCLLNLSDQGYGVDKGIPTLVIAAASVDDVIAITGFGIMLGMTFSQGSALWTGFKGPLELVMGVSYGVVVGAILWVLPYRHEKDATVFRFCMLFVAGLFAVFASKGIGFGGAGALGCLCVAFVAGVGWRNQGWPDEENQVGDYFNLLWKFFQPMLFGLIGTEIRVSDLDPNTIGWGIVTLGIGLTCRVIVSFFSVFGGGLNLKERFFVALAWLPKATVQAAIGSTALDMARGSLEFSTGPPCSEIIGYDLNLNDTSSDVLIQTDTTILPEIAESCEITLGKQVLAIAVLVILITAPIGAVAIMMSAPKLLKKTPPHSLDPRQPDIPE